MGTVNKQPLDPEGNYFRVAATLLHLFLTSTAVLGFTF